MATLNITYQGLSVDYALDGGRALSDRDVRRIAVEVLRTGALRGMTHAHVADDAFDHYVVDRFRSPGAEERIYLRPKVPFGASAAENA